jgi:arabinogalactan endo-1,4-beta-galactosidase
VRRTARATIGLCLFAASAFAANEHVTTGEFLRGGDVSMLPRFEELGAIYSDEGKPADALQIMMNHGCNCFRLRLFVNPAMQNDVIQDLPYVVKLARRVKKAGAVLLLDIHYSDTWADPGRQNKPAAWEHLDFPGLKARVESYTAEVITELKEAGCLPDIVQVGNEITSGFLWPEGRIDAREGGWTRFTALLKAAVRGVKRPLDPNDSVRIMLHIDPGGSATKTAWFFRNIRSHAVRYDLIGLSYYPWWHGSIENLRDNLQETAEEFGKDIVVIETAYPWRADTEGKTIAWPHTPLGQKQFLEDVSHAVRSAPHRLGKGVLWWYPESIPVRGLNVWKGGNAALFDAAGSALPALDAFQEEPHDTVRTNSG